MTGQEISTSYVGIDVDDPHCRMFAVDADRKLILRRSIARENILPSLPGAERTMIGIEYRSGVHGLAHRLMQAGFEVRLIRFRDIPRLRSVSSNADYGRAEALCEAIRMGSTRHVPILAPSERGHAASQRVKALLKRQRSAILNAARTVVEGVDAEQGSQVRGEQQLVHRLHSTAETSAYHRISAALLDVLFVLERNIDNIDEVHPHFEAISDQSFSSIEGENVGAEPDKGADEVPHTKAYNLTRPHPGPCVDPVGQGSIMPA